MKNHTQSNNPELFYGQRTPIARLREIVGAAWDSITPELPSDLVGSIKSKCQAVQGVIGGHTHY